MQTNIFGKTKEKMTVHRLIQQIFIYAQLPIFSESWKGGCWTIWKEHTLAFEQKELIKTKVEIVWPYPGLQFSEEEEWLYLCVPAGSSAM